VMTAKRPIFFFLHSMQVQGLPNDSSPKMVKFSTRRKCAIFRLVRC
jgi:hypothetical protein